LAPYHAIVWRNPSSRSIAGFPTDLGFDLLTVEGVAAVVARTILHVCEQSFGLTHRAEQALRHRKIFFDGYAAEIVNLADPSALENSDSFILPRLEATAMGITVAISAERN
jgi:hypothetical protein